MSGIKRNLSTEEARKFWDHAEKNAREVASWPAWKKGGIAIAVPETSGETRSGDPQAPEGNEVRRS